MAGGTRSEFIDLVKPLHDRLQFYDRTSESIHQPKNDATDRTKATPQSFLDAMSVREAVFVREQHVPLENELDDDDARSFHWVAYASIPAKQPPTSDHGATKNADRRASTSTKIPIGTIRLVPPPHPPHPAAASNEDDKVPNGHGTQSSLHDHEAYIKLGRLAVIPEFRKAGVSRLLIDTALSFARDHPYDVVPHTDPTLVEAQRQEADRGVSTEWRGLVLVHAQTGVQKVWKKYGFVTDESMGTWDEEGIEHVGMWRKLDVTDGRRRSKVLLSSPLASP